jgi:hypothetical protein
MLHMVPPSIARGIAQCSIEKFDKQLAAHQHQRNNHRLAHAWVLGRRISSSCFGLVPEVGISRHECTQKQILCRVQSWHALTATTGKVHMPRQCRHDKLKRKKGGFAQAQHHRYQKLHCGDQAGPSSYQRSKRSAMQGPLVCRLPS